MRLTILQQPAAEKGERLRSIFTKTYADEGAAGAGTVAGGEHAAADDAKLRTTVRIEIVAGWPADADGAAIGKALDDVVAVQRAFLGDDALAQIVERLEARVADGDVGDAGDADEGDDAGSGVSRR